MNWRSFVYDRLITFTDVLYREVLLRLPQGARLLDVGIGTGTPLAVLASMIREKNIHIHGIDIDDAYLAACTHTMHTAGLDAYVSTEHASIVEYSAAATYDAVYFSNSFMIVAPEERQRALQNALEALSPAGHRRIYFTQTHERTRSHLIEILKPLLKYIVSIDFGLVTYEDEFLKTLDTAGLQVLETKELFANRSRTINLIVTSPKI
jgi:ubiquinone/menaquinone biosynthesis C-methylase UbiE